MAEPGTQFSVAVLSTGELTDAQRSSVIDVCIAAHENEAFRDLFEHIPEVAHFLGSRGPSSWPTRWCRRDGCNPRANAS